jgi:predicted Zn-dependent peptidase
VAASSPFALPAHVRIDTLPNGLRVASDSMPHVETVSAGLWIGVGSRHEPEAANGVAHLVEHMLFKGTERRDAFAISAEIENVGGHLNAYTSREQTSYYAKVLKDDLPLALDILSDMLLHSRFDSDELARERDVVLQEIGQTEDTPDDVIYDRFLAAAFPDQLLGRPVLGSAEVVAGMRREDLCAYVSQRYVASNMVLAAAGRVDHDRLVEMASSLFTDLPQGTPSVVPPALYRGGKVHEERDLEQLHLLLGYQGIGVHDDALYDALILSAVLGGGMSSRLFQEAREKRGLAYAIHSFGWGMQDGGVFGVYAGVAPDRAAALLEVVTQEIDRLAATLTQAEVARARAQLKTGQLMGLESTSNRAEQLGSQLLTYGRVIPVAETVARLDAVTVESVAALGRRLFASGPTTLAALGPLGGMAAAAAFLPAHLAA